MGKKNNNILHFDRIASEYETSIPRHVAEHYLNKRINFIKEIVPRGLVLDVGCGTGVIVSALSREGYRVAGVDPSIGMLKRISKKYKGKAAVASACELPFSSNMFDLVINVAVLHHLVDPNIISSSIGEMLRIVKKAGYLLIWDHNPLNPYWKIIMDRVPQDCGEERLISRGEVLDVIHSFKNSVTSIKTSNLGFVPDFIPCGLMPVITKIESIAESTPFLRMFSAHNVFLIKKA